MGCWNGTCMISNLPIISGEKVKLIFLRKGSDDLYGNAAFCYSNGLLTPLNMAITAEYDDYGGVENIVEDWNYKIISEYLKYHFKDGIRCDGEEMTEFELDDIIKAVERGELESHLRAGIISEYEFVYQMRRLIEEKANLPEVVAEAEKVLATYKDKTDNWYNVNMSFIMIREDVWHTCVKNMSSLTNYFHGKFVPGYPTKITYYEFLKLKFEDYIKRYKETTDVFRFVLNSENSLFSDMGESSPRYLFSIEYSKYLHDRLNNSEDISNIKSLWIETKLIEFYISKTRKSWMIQAGAGSQDAEYELMKLHGHMLIDIANKKQNEEDDNYEEEDYEEANA